MSKYIKVEGCHDCPKVKISYVGTFLESHFTCNGRWEVADAMKSKTNHPDCPLDDYEDIKSIKSQLKIAEQQIKELIEK